MMPPTKQHTKSINEKKRKEAEMLADQLLECLRRARSISRQLASTHGGGNQLWLCLSAKRSDGTELLSVSDRHLITDEIGEVWQASVRLMRRYGAISGAQSDSEEKPTPLGES